MSKRDYQAIARAFHRVTSRDSEGVRYTVTQTLDDLRDEIMRVLAADNPRFDRERFIEACETGRCKGMRAA